MGWAGRPAAERLPRVNLLCRVHTNEEETRKAMQENQAEAIAEAFRAAQIEADPVTKADLSANDTDLRHALQETEQRFKAQIDLLRSDLTGKFTLLQWMLGLLLAGVASLVIKSFF
jgi:hypothetical protein